MPKDDEGSGPDIGPLIAPKSVTGYSVDVGARIVLFSIRGPVDIRDDYVAMPYSQLKFVAGQLVMQEGKGESDGVLQVINSDSLLRAGRIKLD